MSVGIGYVVLYVNDTEKTANFWTTNFGFEIKNEVAAGEHKVITIGATDSQTNFELVPLALMEGNPFNLNLGLPSICLNTDDLQAEHERLTSLGVNVTEISDHGGRMSFAVIDEDGNAFAIA
ncbi:VOC family protein [Mollicutes bacterium LVI A0078]|nr:VOC family protein [Mollicutes bacterium LVI A0075]WOO90433.1 VOC family protein [Mollicutes bacterium LVI A0078]